MPDHLIKIEKNMNQQLLTLLKDLKIRLNKNYHVMLLEREKEC